MKKLIVIIGSSLLALGVNAQTRTKTVVTIPEKGISLTSDNFSITDEGCKLSGNVVQGSIGAKSPIVNEHNVPGILTNINQIGGTWVIQCTAGPGYCFTWYTK
jgi:hypothetical protein